MDFNTIDSHTENFKTLLSQNITSIAKYKIGGTSIAVRSKISGKLKYYHYILIYPFIGETFSGVRTRNPNVNLTLFDFNASVDETFYEFMYNEMKKKNNILICSMNEDGWSWELTSNNSLINIYHNYNHFTDLSFKEWYDKCEFINKDYVIEITNPDLYSVPFNVKPLTYKFSNEYDIQTNHPYLIYQQNN